MSWTFHPAADFAAHAAAWDAVNAAGPKTILLDAAFVGPMVEEWAGPATRLAILGDAAAPDVMALVEPAGKGAWQTFQPSQAPLGAWVARAGIALPDASPSLVTALPGFGLALGVTQQDPDFAPRPADGGAVRTLDYIDTARITMPESFDAYWGGRGRNLRKNMRRQRSKLEREGTAVRLETLTDAGDMARAVAEYGELESRSWKAEGGTAIHPDNDQGRFYGRMLAHFAARGEARVWRYFYGDRLVASDLCVHRDGVIVVLKTTYDEAETTTSPALLMREDGFRQIFAEGGFRVIEFYGRVMDWHTKWSDEIRTMYHATWYRNGLVRRLHQWLSR